MKKDDDELDSEKEQEELRKKKRRFPFHAKVGGGLARHRADRKAFRRGGAVASAADGEMESPNVPNAPKGGVVKQKFQDGGSIGSIRRKPKPGESREPPPLTGPVEGLKDGGDTGEKWIGKARASMERRGTVGSLRKAMGVKGDKTIPTSSLEAKKAQAKRTGNTAMMRKVNFALNVRK
jgi:hypothetical protein